MGKATPLACDFRLRYVGLMKRIFEPTRRGFLAGSLALLSARPSSAQGPLVLRAAEAKLPFGDALLATPAFNDLPAGPELRLRKGEPFALRLENGLDFGLRFRAQGLRGKAVTGHDTPVRPGETREIVLTPPDAGSFVYACGSENGRQAARTLFLSGALVVTADQPPVADRDLVLAVNTITVPGETGAVLFRRSVFVNGSSVLDLRARPGERLRLRFVNLAQDALAGLKLPAGARVVALDGQPCDPFPPLDGIGVLPPLGRADVVLDIAPGTSSPLVVGDAFEGRDLVKITVEGERVGERFLAERLPDNPGLAKEIPFRSAARATWKVPGPVADPLVFVKTGASVVLTLENDATPRALLLEGQSARHLDALDDGWKPWWHDTVIAAPGETVRLAFVPTETGRFALDLVPLEGTDAPARAWVEVDQS